MTNTYLLLKSTKVGLDSEEGYVVVRNGISFLRILGGEPNWTVMTPTASEDHGRIQVCPERLRLVESALLLCAEHGGNPKVEKDRSGREYVKIGTITREPGESEDEFQSENAALIQKFFEIFDSFRDLESRGGGEMRKLYSSLAVDDKGGEVYLSDGVWLSSDGSLHNRSR
jgi:hypothetical protein